MTRSIWLAWFLLALAFPAWAAAAPVRLAFLTGDAHSAPALGAVAALRRDPALRDVTVRVFPRLELAAADREFVRGSDLVIAYTRYGDLVRSLAPDLRAARERGALLFGVGGPLDPEFADAGLKRDPALAAYFDAGGTANLEQLLRAALARRHRPGTPFGPPTLVPEIGYFAVTTGRAFAGFDAYAAEQLQGEARRGDRPWVGVYFSRDTATSGQTEVLSAIGAALEARGFRPLFAFGYPPDVAIPRLFLDPAGQPRVVALIGLTLKIGNVPAKLAPSLAALNVPILNAIALNSQTRAEWERSASGLDFVERSWQVGGAELAGAIAPTLVASRERLVDVTTGQSYTASLPIPGRVERLADRIAAWVRLRQLPPADKRIALVYYNYPPGRESVGASYLNVLPDSIGRILDRLRAEGYALGDAPRADADLFAALRTFGSNPAPGPDRAADLDRLARSGRVPLLAVDEYRAWFDTLPAALKTQVVAKWGEPERSTIMTWRESRGPGLVRLPGVALGPGPARGPTHPRLGPGSFGGLP